MPAAARVGDPTGHPGTIGGPGVITVRIGGQPAATVGTPHACAAPTPHPPSVIAPPGSTTVRIGGRPAARVGDLAACGSPILSGMQTVRIGG